MMPEPVERSEVGKGAACASGMMATDAIRAIVKMLMFQNMFDSLKNEAEHKMKNGQFSSPVNGLYILECVKLDYVRVIQVPAIEQGREIAVLLWYRDVQVHSVAAECRKRYVPVETAADGHTLCAHANPAGCSKAD